jgi:hypothetical protein
MNLDTQRNTSDYQSSRFDGIILPLLAYLGLFNLAACLLLWPCYGHCNLLPALLLIPLFALQFLLSPIVCAIGIVALIVQLIVGAKIRPRRVMLIVLIVAVWFIVLLIPVYNGLLAFLFL